MRRDFSSRCKGALPSLIVIATTPSVLPCSELSRCGLAMMEPRGNVGATANLDSPLPRDSLDLWVGAKKRASRSNKETDKEKRSEPPADRLDKKSPIQVGNVNFNVNQADGIAMLGFAIGRAHWGKGFGSEAVRAAIAWSFEAFALDKVWATTDARNVRSQRLMEKLGMQLEGRLRSHQRARDGRTDEICYGLLRTEWQQHAYLPSPTRVNRSEGWPRCCPDAAPMLPRAVTSDGSRLSAVARTVNVLEPAGRDQDWRRPLRVHLSGASFLALGRASSAPSIFDIATAQETVTDADARPR